MYKNLKQWIYFGFLLFVDLNLPGYILPLVDQVINSSMISRKVTYFIFVVILSGLIFLGVKKEILPKIHISFKAMKFSTFRTGLILCCIATIISALITVLLALITSDLLVIGGNVSSENHLLSAVEKALYMISTCVGAPIVEELMYRGVLVGILKRTFGIKIAIVVSSLVFGVLHLTSVIVVINAFIMGMVFAYIYAKSNNLAYSMALHSLMNIIVTLKSFGL